MGRARGRRGDTPPSRSARHYSLPVIDGCRPPRPPLCLWEAVGGKFLREKKKITLMRALYRDTTCIYIFSWPFVFSNPDCGYKLYINVNTLCSSWGFFCILRGLP